MTKRKPASDDDRGFLLDPSLATADAKLKAALGYWESRRMSRVAPARADLAPRDMKDFLPHFQILELVDGGPAYRPRLMGTAMVAQMKEDITGRLIDDATSETAAQRSLRAVRWVMEHKKPLRTFAPRTAIKGREFLSHESVFLPLSSDGETIDMLAVVGVFAPAVS